MQIFPPSLLCGSANFIFWGFAFPCPKDLGISGWRNMQANAGHLPEKRVKSCSEGFADCTQLLSFGVYLSSLQTVSFEIEMETWPLTTLSGQRIFILEKQGTFIISPKIDSFMDSCHSVEKPKSGVGLWEFPSIQLVESHIAPTQGHFYDSQSGIR